MTMFRASVDMMPTPEGGFEFAIGDDKVSARTAPEIMPKVRRLLMKHNISADPEIALAEYMCPRLGRQAAFFCTGDVRPVSHVTPKEALANCAQYAKLPMVPFDVIQRRMGICSSCPKHERNWCLTCTGAFAKIEQLMGGGRRPLLPADRFSGVCGCAKAYEAVVCSVDHPGEPWPDAPAECWRRRSDV